jgi:hypothetical protein
VIRRVFLLSAAWSRQRKGLPKRDLVRCQDRVIETTVKIEKEPCTLLRDGKGPSPNGEMKGRQLMGWMAPLTASVCQDGGRQRSLAKRQVDKLFVPVANKSLIGYL